MSIISSIGNAFNSFINLIPGDYRILVNLFMYSVFIAIYAVFVWKFYRFLASRDIIELNLKQYNYSQRPGLEKFFAFLLFIAEYLIILPFMVLFWFTILSLFLLILAENQSASIVLTISAAIIASTRITCYISEELSKDLAKTLPFLVLATYILNPSFFQSVDIFSRILEAGSLLSQIFKFILFIFLMELLSRFVYSIYHVLRPSHLRDSEIKRKTP